MTRPPLTVAVVGARRVRQGTGEFVARELQRAGCRVTAIVGTSHATLDATRRDLAARHGIEATGWLSLEALLAEESVDAVAICSPPETHERALEACAAARVHVLCEKPLWWGPDLDRAPGAGPALADRVARLVDRFGEAGKALELNAQWPFTLPSFDALHPGRAAAPRTFRMWMGPTREAGPAMVVDSGSHPISMLQALVGPGTMQDARVTTLDRDRGRLDVAWRWVHGAGETRAELRLTRHPAPPRPAGYEIDGRVADRRIDAADYSMAFADGERQVPVPDPLVACVRDFARAAAEGRPPARRHLIEGMTALHGLVAAVEGAQP